MNFECFVLAESGLEDYLVATYLMSSAGGNILEVAAMIASEQTTGTWVGVPGEEAESLRRYEGKLLNVWEIPDIENTRSQEQRRQEFIIQIAYPWENFGPQLPMLLTTTFGNISMIGDIKLLDLHFPPRLVEGLPGPRYGVQGIRNLLGVPERPLLNTMIKPSIGITPEQGAELLYQAAVGGTDIIKDDEVLSDPNISPIDKRLDLYMKKLQKAESEVRENKLYAVNVTDEPERCLQKARRAVKAGANAIMINFLPAGLGLVSSLARDPEINVPILAHLDFGGALYASPRHGVSSSLLYGKLARLAGVDLLTIPTPYGKFALPYEKYMKIVAGLRNRLYKVKRVFPIIGGGINQAHLPQLFNDLEQEFIIGAGGAVYAHPMGAAAGARAFRQGIDLLLGGGSFTDTAEYPELTAALEKWGGGVSGA